MYKSILFPVDLGNTGSWNKALPVAIAIARDFGAQLHLVAVVPDVGMSIVSNYLPAGFEEKAVEHAAEELHKVATDSVPEDIRGQSHVAHGTVREEIIKAAGTLGCDLIVMAPHRPEMMDFLISPNTEFVVKHAKISVLVVRG